MDKFDLVIRGPIGDPDEGFGNEVRALDIVREIEVSKKTAT
jgi:hypothetical protein